MNDTASQQPVNQNQTGQQQPVQPGGVPVVSQPQQAPVSQPVSIPQKEQLVGLTVKPEVPLIVPSEAQLELSREVAEIGVEKSPETVDLTDEQKQAGISYAKESVPVSTTPSGQVQLPMTEVQAKQVIKTQRNVSDSILWLATLILKQIKEAHQRITA